MALSAANLGRTWGPVTATADARWTMAYAAGIGDDSSVYYATDAGPVPAHPLFSVSAEWALLIESIASSGAWSHDDALRGVHATHDLVIHSPLLSGTSVTVRAEVVSLERRAPGAYQVIRHEAHDLNGTPLWTSWTGALYRGVDVDGPDAPSPLAEPAPAPGPPLAELPLPIGALDALTYTECARIWNPIHTDVAIARQAGLERPILHGTATLAKTVSAILRHADARPQDVTGLHVRFSRPADLPSDLTLRIYAEQPDGLPFDVVNSAGQPVLRDGRLRLAGLLAPPT